MLNCSNRFTWKQRIVSVSEIDLCLSGLLVQLLAKTAPRSDLKILKAEDVKNPNRLEVFFPFDLLIDLEDDPGETLGI